MANQIQMPITHAWSMKQSYSLRIGAVVVHFIFFKYRHMWATKERKKKKHPCLILWSRYMKKKVNLYIHMTAFLSFKWGWFQVNLLSMFSNHSLLNSSPTSHLPSWKWCWNQCWLFMIFKCPWNSVLLPTDTISHILLRLSGICVWSYSTCPSPLRTINRKSGWVPSPFFVTFSLKTYY